MSKEYIEALGKLTEIAYGRGARPENNLESRILEKNLQRLEAIDNSNPSEALELVGYLKDYFLNMIPYDGWLDDIEKYILKAQEQEKVLKIIRECLVCEFKLFEKDGCYFILFYFDDEHELIFKLKNKEEFDLLKRYCK